MLLCLFLCCPHGRALQEAFRVVDRTFQKYINTNLASNIQVPHLSQYIDTSARVLRVMSPKVNTEDQNPIGVSDYF